MLFHAESVHSAFLSTPSARRATAYGLNLLDVTQISIHALREEGDVLQMQSISKPCNFYPRPPRGGRRSSGLQNRRLQV